MRCACGANSPASAGILSAIAAGLPDISASLRVWETSAGRQPEALDPGSDVVLHAPRSHGAALPAGTLLDDWLDTAARERVDRLARQRMAAWRERRDPLLTVDGVCLPWVHEQELYADVFLRETRIVEGLRELRRRGARDLMLERMDRELSRCLETLLGEGDASVRVESFGPSPAYPLAFRAARRPGGLVSAARQATGIPGRARGSVLLETYWHLTPVCEPLAARADTVPVINPLNPPALRRDRLACLARRGGWIGSPGARARRRSAAGVAACLGSLLAEAGPAPLDRLLDLRAAALLGAVATVTPAEVEARRSAFRSGNLRATLAYADTVPVPRMNALVAREHGASFAVVQHGLVSYIPRDDDGRPAPLLDGWEAEVVGVWSERDRIAMDGVPAQLEVTGNPGAAALSKGSVPPPAPSPSALVLGQMTSPLSTAADIRVTARHLHAALEALSLERPGTRVTVRPHSLDDAYETYRGIASGYPALDVSVSSEGGIESAIEAADLCIGSPSTATLQAAALGRPSLLLDVLGLPLEWPFDRGADFPVAHDATGLRELIAGPAGQSPVGREAALEALGGRPDATELAVELVARSVR